MIIVSTAGCGKPAAEKISTAAPRVNTITETSLMPTSTPVWFPPTPTYTPIPSPTPGLEATYQANLEYGKLILEDNFNNDQSWTYGKFGTGSILFGINELSIGVIQKGEYLSSLRSDTEIGDYYLEITASPSICGGEDEFGVLFHVSQDMDFFRFGINCNGEARLDRHLDGVVTVSHSLTRYGAIPVGGPISSTIGIQTIGKTASFFVNGSYLFTIQDPSITSGGVGVFAHAASQNALTVNFSNLKIYEAIQ